MPEYIYFYLYIDWNDLPVISFFKGTNISYKAKCWNSITQIYHETKCLHSHWVSQGKNWLLCRQKGWNSSTEIHDKIHRGFERDMFHSRSSAIDFHGRKIKTVVYLASHPPHKPLDISLLLVNSQLLYPHYNSRRAHTVLSKSERVLQCKNPGFCYLISYA